MDKEIDELFFTRSIKKQNLTPTLMPISKNHIPLRQGYGVRNLISASEKAPQVVVKIPKRHGHSNGLKGISNNLDYITRNGKLEIEDEDGNIYFGKKEVMENLNKLGMPKQSNRRESINFVFSMPPKTDPIKLKNAVRNFTKEQFKNYYYYFVLHTDEPHPHVHLCLIIKGKDGQRLNPRKADLMEYRIKFADHLRDFGIKCTATYRIHHGKQKKYQNSTIEHIKQRGGVSYVEKKDNSFQPNNPFEEKTKETLKKLSKNYRKILQKLQENNRPKEALKFKEFIQEFDKNKNEIFKNQEQHHNIENDVGIDR
ncbi:MAG: plasmid recombination protein [Neisseriaceae bacterium]|nr:plasmid recombination protein [Neisseriaceae bacterium]